MNITLNVTVNTGNPTEDATIIAEKLRDKNLPRTKIKQQLTKPEEGELSIVEWANIIEIAVGSGFALGTVNALLGFLKGLFVEIPIVKIEAETKKYEIETNKEIETAKLQQRDYFVELNFECGDRKYHFKLTKNDPQQEKEILEVIKEIEENCK